MKSKPKLTEHEDADAFLKKEFDYLDMTFTAQEMRYAFHSGKNNSFPSAHACIKSLKKKK